MYTVIVTLSFILNSWVNTFMLFIVVPFFISIELVVVFATLVLNLETHIHPLIQTSSVSQNCLNYGFYYCGKTPCPKQLSTSKPITEGSQGRSLEAGTGTKTMKEHCLLPLAR